MLKVTTSWDDGDALDTRLSNLLLRYSIKGTFYITKNYRLKRLSDEEIRELSVQHEIGAHTLTHPDLRNDQTEIRESKEWLENLLGLEVKMFCYPKGRYNDLVVKKVKEAGFLGARTTELGKVNITNPYIMPITIQVYPVTWRSFKQRGPGLRNLGVSIFSMYSWLNMSKSAFDSALRRGGVFHLYGHSWEIEKYHMWNQLEKLLEYISYRTDCVYVTNSELIQ